MKFKNKEHYGVAILRNSNPEKGEIGIRFVTDMKQCFAEWDAGKKAMLFTKSYAEDTAYCLQMNGYLAVVVDFLYAEDIENPEQSTDKEGQEKGD